MAKLCAECKAPMDPDRIFRIYLWPGGKEIAIECCSGNCLCEQRDKYEAAKKEQP